MDLKKESVLIGLGMMVLMMFLIKNKSFLVGVIFLDESNRRESSGNSQEGGMPVRKQSSSSSEE